MKGAVMANTNFTKALVVLLLIFVLLTLGLAVSTYYALVEQNRLRAEGKEARDRETKAVQNLESALAKANANIARLNGEYEVLKASVQAELDELQKSLQAKSKELTEALAGKWAEYN